MEARSMVEEIVKLVGTNMPKTQQEREESGDFRA